MKMLKKLLLICNPKSGRGLSGDRLLKMLQFYRAKGFLPAVYLTEKGDDLTEALSMAEPDTFLVVSGGDGMINACANAMLKKGPVLPFGYLPAGTTNDFARSIGIPTEPEEALAASISEETVSLDAGRLENRYFMYVAGFGLFTDVAYKTPQRTKNAFGYLAYVMNGIKSISELKTLSVTAEVDGEPISGEFILGLVTNSMSVAGRQSLVKSETRLDDGKFELLLIRRPQKLSELNTLLESVLYGSVQSPLIVYRQGRDFRFTGDPLSWTLDGEFGGSFSESRILVSGSLRLRRGGLQSTAQV